MHAEVVLRADSDVWVFAFWIGEQVEQGDNGAIAAILDGHDRVCNLGGSML